MREVLEALARQIGGVRAVLVVEASGIEVASWGDTDFEVAAAEWAELWRQVRASDGLAPGGAAEAVSLTSRTGTWVVLPLGTDYLLALLAEPGVAAGRVRFYGREWAAAHGEDFA